MIQQNQCIFSEQVQDYEDEIKEKFIKAFAVFFHGKEVICQTVNDFIRTLSDFSSIDSKISTILQEMQYIADLNELNSSDFLISAEDISISDILL